MERLHWENAFKVGVKEIDDQHMYFIGLVGKIDELVGAGEIDEKLDDIINTIEEYAVLHFQTEEKYFDQVGFEGRAEHKEKHRELLDQVDALMKGAKGKDKTSVGCKAADFLFDWLVEHLADYDMKYAECFKEHGLR